MNVFTKDKVKNLGTHPHGTHHRYYAGCRCLPCRAGAANYRLLCLHRQKAGTSDPLIPADQVVRHLRKLSRAGVGYRSVEAITGVRFSTMQRLKNRQRRYIKKSSAEKILAVTKDAHADHGRVKADATYKQVDLLLQQGFTYTELAKRAQVGRSVLSHRREFITAKTRMRIEKFFNQIMTT